MSSVILGVVLITMAVAMLGGMGWGLAWLYQRNQRKRLEDHRWLHLGERLELRYMGPQATTAGMARRFGGRARGRNTLLTVLERPSATDWTLRLELCRSALPRDLSMDGGLEFLGIEALRLRPGLGDQRDLGLVRVPSHAGPFLGSVLTVHGGRHVEFQLTSVGLDQAEETLESVRGLLERIEASIDEGWIQAGRGLGLLVGLARDGVPPELSGELEGSSIYARVHNSHPAWLLGQDKKMEPQAWTEIVARWSNPRLADLEVALPERLPGEPKLEVPVLDMLVAVRCSDRDSARGLLGESELTEALLAVVHGCPGSQVLPGQVRLRRDGEPGAQSEELIRKTARLARLLSEAGA